MKSGTASTTATARSTTRAPPNERSYLSRSFTELSLPVSRLFLWVAALNSRVTMGKRRNHTRAAAATQGVSTKGGRVPRWSWPHLARLGETASAVRNRPSSRSAQSPSSGA